MTPRKYTRSRSLIATAAIIACVSFTAIAMSLASPAPHDPSPAKDQSRTSLANFVGRSIHITHRAPGSEELSFDNGRLEHADSDWIAFRQLRAGFTVWIPADRVYRIEVVD